MTRSSLYTNAHAERSGTKSAACARLASTRVSVLKAPSSAPTLVSVSASLSAAKTTRNGATMNASASLLAVRSPPYSPLSRHSTGPIGKQGTLTRTQAQELPVKLLATLKMIIPHLIWPSSLRLSSLAGIFLLTSSLLQDSQRIPTINQNLANANHHSKQEYATCSILLILTIGGNAHSSRVAFAGTAVLTG